MKTEQNNDRHASKPEYRFNYSIVDETTGLTIVKGDTYISERVGVNGECESVDMEVASAMRAFKKRITAHEAGNYSEGNDAE